MTNQPPAPTSDAGIRELLDSIPTGILIGNEWRESSSGERFDVLNPATGEVLTTVASATPEDAAEAMDLAARTQRSWQATSPRERADILRRAYDLVVGPFRERLARVMTLEMGKPLDQADAEVTYGSEFLRWFAEEADRKSVV